MPSPQLRFSTVDSPAANTSHKVIPTFNSNNALVTDGNGISYESALPDKPDSSFFQERHDDQSAHRIHRVPPEILIQVFLQFSCTNRRSPPWCLTHICRLWREIALNTPQLWKRIPLPALHNHVERAKSLVAFLPEYLARSKDQTIVFNWEGNWDPESLEEEDEFEDPFCGQSNVILDLLIQHAERWGRVSMISGRWTHKFEYQLSQLRNRLPRLYHLELGSNSLHVMYVESFRIAPHLREVKLYTPVDPNNSQLFYDFINWSQIQRLKLTVPSSTTLPQVNLFQHLMELDLEYAGSDVAAFGSERLELPNLKTLSLRSPSDLSSNHFNLLSVPSLKDLRVFSILSEPEPLCSFLRFLQRYSTSLQCLTIGHIHFMYFRTSSPETRIDFISLPFGVLKNLAYLQLHHPPLDKLSAFLQAIGQGHLRLPFQCLHIIFKDFARLSDTYINEIAGQLRAVIVWAENTNSESSLRRILINLGELNDCWEFLAALEGWPEEFTPDLAQPFITFCMCEKTLQDVYHFNYINDGIVIATTFDEDETQKIGGCLDLLDLNIDQVQLLYCTRLHFITQALSKLSADQFTPGGSDIPERASTLVNRWKVLFEGDVSSRRWMHRGFQKLVYVPGNDDLIRPNIENWMYGLTTEWETEELDDLF